MYSAKASGANTRTRERNGLGLIPTRPSPHDLRAAGVTVDLAESLGKPLMFVINAATPRARITTESAIALSQHGTVAPSIIHQRTEFAASMIDGRTVMELPNAARSALEISLLWDYIESRLNRGTQRTNMPNSNALPSATAAPPSKVGMAGAK